MNWSMQNDIDVRLFLCHSDHSALPGSTNFNTAYYGCRCVTVCVCVGEVDERISRRAEWEVDDRRHSGAAISSAGRGTYSDRLQLDSYTVKHKNRTFYFGL